MHQDEFDERWKENKQLFLVNNEEFRVVTIHPFGDELQIIQKLKITPEDCTYVGSYIQTKKLISFVEFETSSQMLSNKFSKGIYYRLNENMIYSKLVSDEIWLSKTLVNEWIENMVSAMDSSENLKEFVLKHRITNQYKTI